MYSRYATRSHWQARVAEALHLLRTWPWFDTLRTLRQRFREDRLGLTAGSLTFTTLIAIVPLVTVMLALFTAFPIFAKFQDSLQKYFLQSLVPDTIAKPVLGALTQFALKANKLGSAGLIFLGVSALSLMLTIDRTLNAIWRVRQPRSMAQRVLVYWAGLTLGPLVLGVSLSVTSYALSASRGLVGEVPGVLQFLLSAVEFGLLALTMTGLFHYVPNTPVRWRHAAAGGLFVAVGIELAKKLLGLFVGSSATYSTIYGAFAAAPIFLLWIYLAWVIVLLGAVIAAYAPSLQMHIVSRPAVPGWRFALALAVLGELAGARLGDRRGLDLLTLAERLRSDPLQIEPIVETLVGFDWLARIDEDGDQRLVLLCDPARTPARALLDAFLLGAEAPVSAFRSRAGFEQMTLAELLS